MAEGFGSSVLGSERFQLRQQAGYLFHDGSGISLPFSAVDFGITDSSIAGNLLPVTRSIPLSVNRLNGSGAGTIASLFQLHQIWSVMENTEVSCSPPCSSTLPQRNASRHDRPPVHRMMVNRAVVLPITDIWLEVLPPCPFRITSFENP